MWVARESCELGTSKMESPKKIPQAQGEGERGTNRVNWGVRMEPGKPLSTRPVTLQKLARLDFYPAGIPPAMGCVILRQMPARHG